MSEKLCTLRKIGGGNGLLGSEVRGFIDTELYSTAVGGNVFTVEQMSKISSLRVTQSAGNASVPIAQLIWRKSDNSVITRTTIQLNTDIAISAPPSEASDLVLWIRAQGGNYAWLEYTVTLNK